jgi:hypothetical protein
LDFKQEKNDVMDIEIVKRQKAESDGVLRVQSWMRHSAVVSQKTRAVPVLPFTLHLKSLRPQTAVCKALAAPFRFPCTCSIKSGYVIAD